MTQRPEHEKKKRIEWGTVLPIVIGLLILVVPTTYILNLSESVFREECKQRCALVGQEYTIKATGLKSGTLDYPAECICLLKAEPRWWEFWK